MNIENETKWLCENARNLEKFSGQWVLFSVHEGVVKNGASLRAILKARHDNKIRNKPFIFHVPSKKELASVTPF